MVIPVAMKYAEYANSVAQKFKDAGLFAEVDESANTLNKMIRNAQVGQWSFVMGMSFLSLFFHSLFPWTCSRSFIRWLTSSFSPGPHIFGRMKKANNQSSDKKRWKTKQ